MSEYIFRVEKENLITIVAKTRDEAYEKADELYDDDVTNIELVEIYEEEEKEYDDERVKSHL